MKSTKVKFETHMLAARGNRAATLANCISLPFVNSAVLETAMAGGTFRPLFVALFGPNPWHFSAPIRGTFRPLIVALFGPYSWHFSAPIRGTFRLLIQQLRPGAAAGAHTHTHAHTHCHTHTQGTQLFTGTNCSRAAEGSLPPDAGPRALRMRACALTLTPARTFYIESGFVTLWPAQHPRENVILPLPDKRICSQPIFIRTASGKRLCGQIPANHVLPDKRL